MLVGLALVMSLVILSTLVRLGRALWQARHGRDLADILLAVASRRLPADRRDWGDAMHTELACIYDVADRRRFAMGAFRATTTARLMGRPTPRPGLSLVVAGVIACTGLAAAVLIGYPSLRGSPHVPLVLAVLAVALAGYTTLAAANTAEVGAVAATIRRWSVLVGGLIAAAWFVFATAWWHLHGAPLGVAVLVPMVAGAITARATGNTRAGITMATWAGVVGGMTVFITLMIDAFMTSTAPHAGSRASGVGEALATSSMLLLLVPCLTVAAGTAGAVIANISLLSFSRRFTPARRGFRHRRRSGCGRSSWPGTAPRRPGPGPS